MIRNHEYRLKTYVSTGVEPTYTEAYYEVRPDAMPEATKIRHAKD